MNRHLQSNTYCQKNNLLIREVARGPQRAGLAARNIFGTRQDQPVLLWDRFRMLFPVKDRRTFLSGSASFIPGCQDFLSG